jgi:hypothetical protein
VAVEAAGDAYGGSLDALTFAVAAELVYQIYGSTNSSPQTTELFAGDRAATLWKYVRFGGVQAVFFVGVMAIRGYRSAFWALAGGGSALASMWWMYHHAMQAGGGSPDE